MNVRSGYLATPPIISSLLHHARKLNVPSSPYHHSVLHFYARPTTVMRITILFTAALLGVAFSHRITRRQASNETTDSSNSTVIEDEHVPVLTKSCVCPPDSCPPFLNSENVSRRSRMAFRSDC